MSPDVTSPISATEFAQLLEKSLSPHFSSHSPKVAVAVSGGPDSMALAFCVQRWSSSTFAFIVDHGLRAESAAEARQVKDRLEKMGVQTEILHWHHDPVKGRLHEQAREARYSLLLEACRRHGIGSLFVAHHREDQAETILMRVAKGSGIEGMAGMASHVVRQGINILRPFLSLPKERLVATCVAAEIAFVTDPSNSSEKFARGRLRKIMPLLTAEGLSVENLLLLGARAKEASEAIDFYTKAFLERGAKIEIGGNLSVARASLCALPRFVALRALTLCLRFIHEGGYPPEPASLSTLLDNIADKTAETTRTFYGCIVSWGNEKLSILREPSAATQTLSLSGGQTLLWDKRWLVSAQRDVTQTYSLRALGNPTHEVLDRLAPKLRHLVPQGRVRASLPALWMGESLEAIPSFEEKGSFLLVYQKQSFP